MFVKWWHQHNVRFLFYQVRKKKKQNKTKHYPKVPFIALLLLKRKIILTLKEKGRKKQSKKKNPSQEMVVGNVRLTFYKTGYILCFMHCYLNFMLIHLGVRTKML